MAFRIVLDPPRNIRVIPQFREIASVDPASVVAAVAAYTKAATTISYIGMAAADVLLDAFTLNRYFNEPLTFDDTDRAILVTKPVSDLFSMVDTSAWAVSKPVTEPLSVSDSFAKTMLFFRVFSDTATFSDTDIVKNVSRVSTDTFSFSDEDLAFSFRKYPDSDSFDFSDASTFNIGKGLTDSITTPADATAVASSKPLTDSYGVTESPTLASSKVLAESFSFTDSSVLHVSPAPSDSFSFTDSFARQVSFIRAFSDAFALDDLANIDSFVKDTEFDKNNVATMGDAAPIFVLGKTLADSYSPSDAINVFHVSSNAAVNGQVLNAVAFNQ